MLPETSAIRSYFAKLGLEEEIADIYLALHVHGPQTISQLARNARVERTRIYRLIDKLMDSNLIEVEPQHKRGVIKAAPIANLRILISQREQELRSLQDELGLIEQVLARNTLSSPALRIQLYTGPTGAKQMRMNMTNTKSELLSILSRDPREETSPQSIQEWIVQCEEQKIQSRVLSAIPASQPSFPYPRGWGVRSLRQSPINTYNLVIYDAVVATFHWENNTTFGMEIHSKEIADTQKAYFEMLWQHSQP